MFLRTEVTFRVGTIDDVIFGKYTARLPVKFRLNRFPFAGVVPVKVICTNTVGDFTFWISLSLSLFAQSKD